MYRGKKWFEDVVFEDFDDAKKYLREKLGLSDWEAESYVKDFYDCEKENDEEL